MSEQIEVIVGDINNETHCSDMLTILNLYMLDPMGIRSPLLDDLKDKIVNGLRQHPNYLLFLAYVGNICVGMANCFVGFSTFKASNLLNIHDFVVHPNHRRNGVGDSIMNYILCFSKEKGFCRVNLEVRRDNNAALSLYARNGFSNCSPPMLFLEHNL